MHKLNLQIPEIFFEPEERCGYTISAEMKKVWAVLLDLLNELMRVCAKYNIEYWADGGTMLGAIRHSGFIPWDDDIDIIMTRENYNKLCNVSKTEFKYPYFFQTEYNDPSSMRGHAQLRNCDTTGIIKNEYPNAFTFNQGIFIDIFPLDYVPDNNKERTLYIKKAQRLIWCARLYNDCTGKYRISKKWYKKIVKAILHQVLPYNGRPNKFFCEFENWVNKNNTKKTQTLCKLFFTPVEEKYIWKTDWFTNTLEFSFEMLTLPIASGYMEIMNKFYGNWRTPINTSSTHGKVIFDADKPYTEYLNNKTNFQEG